MVCNKDYDDDDNLTFGIRFLGIWKPYLNTKHSRQSFNEYNRHVNVNVLITINSIGLDTLMKCNNHDSIQL